MEETAVALDACPTHIEPPAAASPFGEPSPAPSTNGVDVNGSAGERELGNSATVRELEAERARRRRAEGQAARAVAALERAERELALLRELEAECADLRNARYWLDVLESSLSWRLTRPLRWATRQVSRSARRAP
jgi:hypothetical protein